ncbi:MAG TPA: DUF4097 family beta strand repeat-containing protein [Thermotogota bacterium]|nr:DUF4097 family beta strand repeat-containing protein [Thermotogota bacterium]HPJ88679.1 DUF4097 family beta strand repeat-containing protein [Thermotogota bacterium]HPR95972.1 DUF4097 family beta strand repeat-containing protein [Thermotogota bacterium]
MSFFQKTGSTDIENIDEIIISTVGGDFEIEGVNSQEYVSWEAIWERDSCDVEIVKNDRKLIIRFDDKSNIVKFLGITISTSFGNLYKAKINIPQKMLEKISVNTVSGGINIKNMDVKKLKVTSTSGNIFNENSSTKSLLISTKSGDLKAFTISNEKKASFTSISGDIGINDIDSDEIICTSKSGDLKIENVSNKARIISANNVSGDIAVKNIPVTAKLTTVSGDIMIKNINNKADWETRTVSGDINVLTSPLDIEIDFNTVSGEAIFKKRDPQRRGKGHYCFGEGKAGILSSKTVSGDLVIKTDNFGVRAEYGTREEAKEEKRKHDPDAERIVFSCSQGIITEDEAKEMLKILEYSDEEIDRFMEDLYYLKKENQRNEDTDLHEPEIIEEIYDNEIDGAEIHEEGKAKPKTKIDIDLELGNGKEPYVFKRTIEINSDKEKYTEIETDEPNNGDPV